MKLKLILLVIGCFSFSILYGQKTNLIVVQNYYYPKPGQQEEVYQWRLHASEVRAKLGLPVGRVLKKITGDVLYAVVWECEYPSLEAREKDVKVLDQSEEFKRVQEHMGTLIQNFERVVFETNRSQQIDGEADRIISNRLASNNAIAAHDTAAIARYWSADIIVLTSRNAQLSGKRKNAEAFAQEFVTKQDVIYVRTPDKVEIFSAGAMAAESGTWVGRWKVGTEQVEVSGTYYAKWIKYNDQWLIRAEVYTPLFCSGAAYCKSFEN